MNRSPAMEQWVSRAWITYIYTAATTLFSLKAATRWIPRRQIRESKLVKDLSYNGLIRVGDKKHDPLSRFMREKSLADVGLGIKQLTRGVYSVVYVQTVCIGVYTARLCSVPVAREKKV